MANRFKCTECGNEFKVKNGEDLKGLKCPSCGSVHVTFQSRSFFQRYGVVLITAILAAAAMVLVALIFLKPAGSNTPEIQEVVVDSVNRTISINAVASSPREKLYYSLDNNKTGAFPTPEFTNVPAGKYYVCVIYGDDLENRVLWKNNPVIMPKTHLEISLPPPQVVGVDIVDPTINAQGRIVVHAISSCPVKYILNDSITQKDSIFHRVAPGKYYVSVMDSLGRMDLFSEHIIVPPPPKKTDPEPPPCTNPDISQIEAQINDLFNNSRGDQDLQNKILNQFASRKITVTGKLINTSDRYTIYQYLYRQNIGLPGSIRIRVKDLRFNEFCKITYFEIEEYGNF